MQSNSESRLEIAIEDALAMQVKDFALRKATQQCSSDLCHIYARFLRERKRLGDRLDCHTNHYLVTRLGHLSGTRIANVNDIFSHFFEYWKCASKSGGCTTGHDRERGS